MAELKTKRTDESIETFLEGITDEKKRDDSRTVIEMMRKATKAEPKMWGPSIIGFGDRRYRYDSGREMDWFIVGFSPRKQNLAFYLSAEFESREELLTQLGKHSTGKGCLYIKRLDDVDPAVLRKLIDASVKSKAEK
jgi:hypothetical protein